MFPIRPRSKKPLTRHGFKDATTNPDLIRRWWSTWPDANIGLALGSPAPTLLDIDDLTEGADAIAQLDGVPYTTTGRGRHYYFEGDDERTVTLRYGELRRAGAYGILPPSVHPSGEVYRWVVEGELTPVPGWVLDDRVSTGGTGIDDRPIEPVHAGAGMHEHLKEYATRFARGGICEYTRMLWLLDAEFALVRVPGEDYDGGHEATERLARDYVNGPICQRERENEEADELEKALLLSLSKPPHNNNTLLLPLPVYRDNNNARRRGRTRKMPPPGQQR